MAPETTEQRPFFKRPWVWVVAAIVAVVVIQNIRSFPSGRYTCTWEGSSSMSTDPIDSWERGTGPTGELAGDFVVDVGSWPNRYPLKGRIFTETGPVTVDDWSHTHEWGSRELTAVVPIGDERYQAFCELED